MWVFLEIYTFFMWVDFPFSRGSSQTRDQTKPGLLRCRQILYQLSHRGSPRILEWVAYPFSSTTVRNNSLVLSLLKELPLWFRAFPGGSDNKESACNAGDPSSIRGLGRSPGGGRGNPLQYSCLENSHGPRNLAGYSPWDR